MAELKEEAAACSSKRKEEKKNDIIFPYHVPVRRSSATTIEKFSGSLKQAFLHSNLSKNPISVAIGPYHHGAPQLQEMEEVKRAAQEEFCRVVDLQREVVGEKMLSLAGAARMCYAVTSVLQLMKDGDFADMMFLDGCFLLQFMVSMCPDDPDAPPETDPLMSRAEVHTRIDDIARDVLLLENQVPWLVLEALMEFRTSSPVPVDRFVGLMASAFDFGNEEKANNPTDLEAQLLGEQANHDQPPPHLLGLFYRRQVGVARTQSLRVPRLSSLSTTAVEIAEMGVKLTARKGSKFGDMTMAKRRPGLVGLSGEISLAPLVLNQLTSCWLINMAAYEACLGATQADNFAVSSYISVVALLMNREEDVQELRDKGIINSAFCDKGTLRFFKGLAPYLHVGHRYYHVFERLQEYKQERWVWIIVHRFFYNNFKTIVALLSVAGVLAGLFKTILSLKQPDQR